MKCTCGCMIFFDSQNVYDRTVLFNISYKNSVVLFIILNKTTIKIDKYDAENLCKRG